MSLLNPGRYRLRLAALPFLILVATARSQDSAPVPVSDGSRTAGRVTVDRLEPGPYGLRLNAAGDRSVEFELEIGPLEYQEYRDGVTVRARGADRLAAVGEPDLPGREVFIGLPQEGGVRISARGFGPERRTGVTVRPAVGFDGEPAAPAVDHPGPAELAELAEVFTIRGVRVARVRLNPVRYDPAAREMTAYRRLAVTVRFEREPRVSDEPDRFDPVLERVLLNGATARYWKAGRARSDPVNFFDRSVDWCRVQTETTGVYRVRGADLAAAGYDLEAIDPATIKLYSVGEWEMNGPYPDTMVEVPVHVEVARPDRFGPNDYVAFYAESPSNWRTDTAGSRYWHTNYFTRYRPWWLTWGGEPGRRFAGVEAGGAVNPRTTVRRLVRLEVDRLCPARSGLLWLWERYFKVAGRDTALFDRPLDLPGRDSIESISGRLYGVNPARAPAYPVRLHLNRELQDSVDVTPLPSQPPPADFSFPVSVQAGPGPDTLRFELFGDPERTVYLDWLEVRYRAKLELSDRRPFIAFGFDSAGTHEFGIEGGSGAVLLLDVTDPFRPRRLTGTTVSGRRRDARVVADRPVRLAAALTAELREPVSVERRTPGRLRSRPETADYYIISPDEFHSAARLFARYRDRNIAGIPDARAEAVRLSDIHDDYAFGVEEPGAIKRFLAAGRPVYALFAGDGTYDYRNCLGGDYPPMVPAYQVGYDVDPEVYGQTARSHDVWYTDFSEDGRPEMILGRITSRSGVELRQALDKVRTYETQELGYWARRFLLLADDEYEGSPDRPDPIGFRHIREGCEPLATLTRDLLDPVKVYLTEYPFTGVNDKAGARAELYERLEQGALFWAFFGHGAGFQLTHERVLHIDGVGAVGGGSRNSIAFFGSCGVGRYDDTRFESVAEELVRIPEGGCIATLGASKATHSGPNERFSREFFGGMLEHPGDPLGPAFYAAWLSYTIYNLFGDPAVKPRIPLPGLPLAVAPDTLYPGGMTVVGDSVPAPDGLYGVSVRELDWERHYGSDVGTVRYTLPGYQVHSGMGTFAGGRFERSFLLPTIDYPDTVRVGDGWYARVPGTGAVSLLAWDREAGWSSGRTDLPLGPRLEGEDTRPPTLRLFAGDIELGRGDTTLVPEEFVLRGELEDESGILLAPVPDYGLALVRGSRVQDRIRLNDRFRYDLNSTTRGSFFLPWRADQERDSLTVFASDNFLNRLVATYHIRTSLHQPLRIDSALVWPNPVSDGALFTFLLTRPAFVEARVFTISGRLVRHLPPVVCGFGYNQLHWDGRDGHGNRVANGVYLYKLDARAVDAGIGGGAASVRDRLLVYR